MAARRQARYEARNIRMKELEKKQKEEEENQVNHNSIYPGRTAPFDMANKFFAKLQMIKLLKSRCLQVSRVTLVKSGCKILYLGILVIPASLPVVIGGVSVSGTVPNL